MERGLLLTSNLLTRGLMIVTLVVSRPTSCIKTDIKLSAHDAFLESGTFNAKKFENQIILSVLEHENH